MPKKASMFNSKIMRKIKSLFMILVSEDNGKQNPKEFYTNKYQMHITCSYGYKLVVLMIKLMSLFRHT